MNPQTHEEALKALKKKVRRTRSYTGLKVLVSLATFLATMYFSFSTANHLIHYISSGFTSHDAQFLCTLVLWVIGFSTVLIVSLALASGLTRIVMSILKVD